MAALGSSAANPSLTMVLASNGPRRLKPRHQTGDFGDALARDKLAG
jgi:hypothetical protein